MFARKNTSYELTGQQIGLALNALICKYAFDTPISRKFGEPHSDNRYSKTHRALSAMYYSQVEQPDAGETTYPVELKPRQWRCVTKALEYYVEAELIARGKGDIRPPGSIAQAEDLLRLFRPPTVEPQEVPA